MSWSFGSEIVLNLLGKLLLVKHIHWLDSPPPLLLSTTISSPHLDLHLHHRIHLTRVESPIANCSWCASAPPPSASKWTDDGHQMNCERDPNYLYHSTFQSNQPEPSEMISPVIRKQYSIWVWNDLRVKLLPIRVVVILHWIGCLDPVYNLHGSGRSQSSSLVIIWLEIVVVNPPQSYTSPPVVYLCTYMVVR